MLILINMWNVLKKNKLRLLRFFSSSVEKPVLINILTRTSGRPIGFRKCRESLKNQSYKNFRHIVSYDDIADLTYLNKYDSIDKIKVARQENPLKGEIPPVPGDFKPYNLYCNELLQEVKEGWVIFLDDDDMLSHNNVLKEIVNHIRQNNDNTLFLWYTRFPCGTLLPSKAIFKSKKIVLQQIDTACFLFHSKYKNAVKWDSWWAADFRFIEALSQIIPKQKWLPFAFTQKNNFGDQGRRNDILEKNSNFQE